MSYFTTSLFSDQEIACDLMDSDGGPAGQLVFRLTYILSEPNGQSKGDTDGKPKRIKKSRSFFGRLRSSLSKESTEPPPVPKVAVQDPVPTTQPENPGSLRKLKTFFGNLSTISLKETASVPVVPPFPAELRKPFAENGSTMSLEDTDSATVAPSFSLSRPRSLFGNRSTISLRDTASSTTVPSRNRPRSFFGNRSTVSLRETASVTTSVPPFPSDLPKYSPSLLNSSPLRSSGASTFDVPLSSPAGNTFEDLDDRIQSTKKAVDVMSNSTSSFGNSIQSLDMLFDVLGVVASVSDWLDGGMDLDIDLFVFIGEPRGWLSVFGSTGYL
jgi:hypothetical protein